MRAYIPYDMWHSPGPGVCLGKAVLDNEPLEPLLSETHGHVYADLHGRAVEGCQGTCVVSQA